VGTTVTLDEGATAIAQRAMDEHGLTLEEVVNKAIRLAFGPAPGEADFRTPTFDMGFNPAVPGGKVLRLAADIEDAELARKLAEGK